MSDPVLQVRDLSVVFSGEDGDVAAANEVSLDLFPGQTLGLVGESGCGKSVTALALLGLVPPPGRIASGSVTLDGAELIGRSNRELDRVRGRRIAMIFQEPLTALNPAFTVGEQIAEMVRVHEGAPRREAWERAVAMLDRVGIHDAPARARTYPHQLSGGMRQRAMIAMAMVCRPGVLIADEPTTALDVTVQARILDLMLELQRDMGTAMLFISHDLAVISEVADSVMVMYAGRVVERAPAAAFFHTPLHPYGRGLLETLPRLDFRQESLPSIPGAVPDPAAPPPGCAFAPRCPIAEDRCRDAVPELRRFGGGRAAACLRVSA